MTITTDRALEEFADYAIAIRNLKSTTLATYLSGLRDFQRRMPEEDLVRATPAVLVRFVGRLYLGGRKVSTRRARRNALRAFFGWMEDVGHRTDNPAAKLPKIEEEIKPPPHFSIEEMNRVVFGMELPPPTIRRGRKEPASFLSHRTAAATLVEPRDTALLGLISCVGLRAAEISHLDRGDYNEKTGELVLQGGKGAKKPQTMWVKVPAVQAAMSLYLTELWHSPWANHPALFPPLYAHVRSRPGHGLTASAVTMILKKRIERAGIEARGRRLSPHTFARYSLGTHLHNGGKDGMSLVEIASILRHRSMDTTRRYVNLGGSAKVASRAAFVLRSFGRDHVRTPDSAKR